MLELKALENVDKLEVILQLLLTLISLITTVYIYKSGSKNYFTYGFALVTIWSFIETIDEFFIGNEDKELILNVGSRIVLLIGIISLISASRKFLDSEKKR